MQSDSCWLVIDFKGHRCHPLRKKSVFLIGEGHRVLASYVLLTVHSQCYLAHRCGTVLLKSVSYEEEYIVSRDCLLISGKHFQSNVEVKDQVKLKYYLLLEPKLKVVPLHNKLKECMRRSSYLKECRANVFSTYILAKAVFVFSLPQLRNIPFELFPWMLCTFLFLRTANSYYDIIRSKSNQLVSIW